jgi:hypothetical protein
MTKESKEKIYSLAKLIGAITVIQGAIFALVSPFAEDYVDDRIYYNLHTPQFKHESKQLIDEYLESAEFKLWIIDFKEELDKRYSKK